MPMIFQLGSLRCLVIKEGTTTNEGNVWKCLAPMQNRSWKYLYKHLGKVHGSLGPNDYGGQKWMLFTLSRKSDVPDSGYEIPHLKILIRDPACL